MEERHQEEDGDIEMQIESDDESSEEDDETPNASVKLSVMENRTGFISHRRDNNQIQDMDEESSDDDDSPTSSVAQPPVAPLLPPSHDKVVVKKYDPKQQQQKPVKPPVTDEFLISPITGERIPASKVAEHMRIGLLDPRWVEQRDKHTTEKLTQENVFAAGSAIEASLKQLAERRTDIFGVGDEETVIGKKLGEEETRKDERVTWDGHTSSVEAATRAARANITLEEQIHQIHKVKGLLPDEEKEKIGPKPVGTGISAKPTTSMSQQNVISAPAQSVIVPPKPAVLQHQPPMPPPVSVVMMPMRPPPMMRMFLITHLNYIQFIILFYSSTTILCWFYATHATRWSPIGSSTTCHGSINDFTTTTTTCTTTNYS